MLANESVHVGHIPVPSGPGANPCWTGVFNAISTECRISVGYLKHFNEQGRVAIYTHTSHIHHVTVSNILCQFMIPNGYPKMPQVLFRSSGHLVSSTLTKCILKYDEAWLRGNGYPHHWEGARYGRAQACRPVSPHGS